MTAPLTGLHFILNLHTDAQLISAYGGLWNRMNRLWTGKQFAWSKRGKNALGSHLGRELTWSLAAECRLEPRPPNMLVCSQLASCATNHCSIAAVIPAW